MIWILFVLYYVKCEPSLAWPIGAIDFSRFHLLLLLLLLLISLSIAVIVVIKYLQLECENFDDLRFFVCLTGLARWFGESEWERVDEKYRWKTDETNSDNTVFDINQILMWDNCKWAISNVKPLQSREFHIVPPVKDHVNNLDFDRNYSCYDRDQQQQQKVR